jgi:hypothetical protein
MSRPQRLLQNTQSRGLPETEEEASSFPVQRGFLANLPAEVTFKLLHEVSGESSLVIRKHFHSITATELGF